MKNKFFKQGVIIALLFAASVFLGNFFGYNIFAESSVTPPSFPACSEKIFTSDGDWAHYDSGIHGIPGVGNFEGSDDVYSLSSGNFLQCFCPTTGSDGTQTNWWNIERSGLTQDQINQFVSAGWVSENGSGWNLFNEPYLAKNSSFSCAQPTPTPPPPGGGGGPPGAPPVCVGSDLGPFAPTLTEVRRIDSDSVHACWTAPTPNANDYIVYYGMSRDNLVWNTKVVDSQCVDIHELPSGHVFLKVAATDNCVVGPYSKTSEQQPQVLGVTVAKGLPETGASVLGLLGLIPVGYYIYKRFRLI
ncbi:hypothetical protein A2865_04765 [Candidatus Woesebacteria bacterium RIFCSPHIGHO2_01_FULL_39_17]|uniref:Fibronectin type-III domain-containing protein n=3 Tax=Candidatus Woeseibacteriota TaxID=1752722 RepID=A0A0G0RI81_9BACT|nr:MAG: hypothetical protein UT19_C0001G0082 [Candidatus Woesebacteria bacterium GW2011_GWB1_39_10b]KKR13372.1 MAG: hypothetical protein UT40_C0018G0017 [Candidatus Woesebacteria bacterium GW2011_GWA1_39_21b]KKS89702.1 MAG: hypothetical protein UV64_C0002G0036 [Parcubacteria group bacterium GW2011_GWC1_43_11b]OGM24330.1 MAG: hypothetical protein A2865_04765 [Candidatus Woesebacteria bacterium RIFCSPHIGHO2_01_FULL_39_17]OGM63872.1 MAG: hypothetical protein A3A52_03865 [Candidatus Woesebacteria b